MPYYELLRYDIRNASALDLITDFIFHCYITFELCKSYVLILPGDISKKGNLRRKPVAI